MQIREDVNRVLIIGLDGADFLVLSDLLSREDIPNIRSLIADGADTKLRSTIPPFTRPAWNSMVTGLNPGKLNMFGLTDTGRNSEQDTTTTHAENPYRLWNVVSDQVGPVVVNNVPPIVEADGVDGAMVAGGLYQSEGLPENAVHPEGLYGDVRDIGVGESRFQEIMKQNNQDFLDTLYSYTEANASCAEFLLKRIDDWRFCMTVFFGPDQIMHKLWPAIDPGHPEHDTTAPRWADAFRDYWSRLDDHVGDLLEYVDEDTTVFLVSDHGFGPVTERFAVNTWLKEEGFLEFGSVEPDSSHPVGDLLSSVGLTKYRAAQLLDRAGLGDLQSKIPRAVRELVPSEDDWVPFDRDAIDWKRTLAYSSGSTGAIYLNRNEGGTNGAACLGEHEEVRTQVRERIEALEQRGYDVQTWTPEEIYSGPYVDNAPDLLYLIDEMAVLPTPVRNDAPFFYSKTAPPVGAAHHRRDGVFVAHGRGIDSSSLPDVISIFDIAPTVLHLLGASIPTEVDGAPATEILTDPIASREPDWIELPALGEQKQIPTDNLRDLGYI